MGYRIGKKNLRGKVLINGGFKDESSIFFEDEIWKYKCPKCGNKRKVSQMDLSLLNIGGKQFKRCAGNSATEHANKCRGNYRFAIYAQNPTFNNPIKY